MEKDKRVHIARGRKGKGQSGTVFWLGPDNYDGGERCGIHADNGETYWVKTEYLEAIDDDEAEQDQTSEEKDLRKVEKGSLVRWAADGKTGTGFVFWIGETKSEQKRLGLNDNDTREKLWMFPNQVRLLTNAEEEELLKKGHRLAPKRRVTTERKTQKNDTAQPHSSTPDSQKPSPEKADSASRNPSTTNVEEMTLFDLVGAAKTEPYLAFAECEHRLQQDGPSSKLKLTANAVAGMIEAKLLAPESHDEIIDVCMEFIAEFGVHLFIENEPEEGIKQAIKIVKETLSRFEQL